jgi:hypothetical protein
MHKMGPSYSVQRLSDIQSPVAQNSIVSTTLFPFLVGTPMAANPPVNLATFGRWTLRGKAAQRRLP